MDIELPDNLKEEQQALEAEIREAFRGVNRIGGRSWSESDAIDLYESPEEIAAARARDTESSWEELVEGEAFNDETTCGGFVFLDPIGFRYYVAPAMIRSIRRQYSEALERALAGNEDFWRENYECLNSRQEEVIDRFIRFMIALPVPDWSDEESWHGPWRAAHDYWRQRNEGKTDD